MNLVNWAAHRHEMLDLVQLLGCESFQASDIVRARPIVLSEFEQNVVSDGRSQAVRQDNHASAKGILEHVLEHADTVIEYLASFLVARVGFFVCTPVDNVSDRAGEELRQSHEEENDTKPGKDVIHRGLDQFGQPSRERQA